MELQQLNLPNSLCQTKCACQPDLKTGDKSHDGDTILVMCWVLLQGAWTWQGEELEVDLSGWN